MRWSFIAAILFLNQPLPAQTGHFSDFGCFINKGVTGGYWGDGFVCCGPFHCNGPICIWSASAGSDNDPWFYSLTLGSPFYYYSTGTPTNPVTTPIVGNLTIQPIEFMEQGPPWFNLGADSIQFGPDVIDWQEARDAALTGGLYFSSASPLGPLPSGSRIILREDSLLVRISSASPIQHYYLGDLAEHVVWVENGVNERILIKDYSDTWPGLTCPLTIGTIGDVYFAGPLTYGGPEGLLGVMAVYGDLVLASDPIPDWTAPWDIQTNSSFELCCSMISLSGILVAENPGSSPLVDVSISSYQEDDEGITQTPVAGFEVSISYDQRLFLEWPPHYPAYEPETDIGDGFAPAATEPLSLSVSANPFLESVYIQASGVPGAVEYMIYDLSGRLLMEQGSTDGSLQICGPAFPPGVLIVRATSQGSTATLRLVHVAE
jgi:hypothetical protein